MRTPKYLCLTPEQLLLCNERTCQIYNELHRWVWWQARNNEIPGNWYMNAQDVAGECYLVLIKVVRSYPDKPYSEVKILCKASVRNYIGSMRYKIALTHRKSELNTLSLDEPLQDDGRETLLGDTVSMVRESFSDSAMVMSTNPEYLVEATEEFLDKAELLSSFDLLVLDAILGYDERVGVQIRLVSARKRFVYSKNGASVVTITPLIVARALNENVDLVEASFGRLKELFI